MEVVVVTLITIEQLVKENIFPGKDVQGIRDWLSRGVLPYDELSVKIGNKRYIVKEKLEEFILSKLKFTVLKD